LNVSQGGKFPSKEAEIILKHLGEFELSKDWIGKDAFKLKQGAREFEGGRMES
jgi:hypothetical protein